MAPPPLLPGCSELSPHERGLLKLGAHVGLLLHHSAKYAGPSKCSNKIGMTPYTKTQPLGRWLSTIQANFCNDIIKLTMPTGNNINYVHIILYIPGQGFHFLYNKVE
jgi:hypothetical protein